MHYNLNWNKDRVNSKNSHLKLFHPHNLLTNLTRYSPDLESGCRTRMVEELERIGIWRRNLALRFCGKKRVLVYFAISNYKIKFHQKSKSFYPIPINLL